RAPAGLQRARGARRRISAQPHQLGMGRAQRDVHRSRHRACTRTTDQAYPRARGQGLQRGAGDDASLLHDAGRAALHHARRGQGFRPLTRPLSPPGSATRLVRIFTACHGTQLLVIQHLRRHLQLPAAREFLLWHPMQNIPLVAEFMRSLIATAGFADTLDMRQFASLRPRTQGPWQWWLESARRLRSDATTLHRWMESNRIAPEDAELWADDPIHFNVIFTRGMLHKSRHVKIPHCFNLEDVTIRDFKNNLEKTWRKAHWPKRFIYHPWLRWSSGVDLRVERTVYDRAYTFDQPSPWSTHS